MKCRQIALLPSRPRFNARCESRRSHHLANRYQFAGSAGLRFRVANLCKCSFMATAHGSVLLAMGIEAEASGLPGAPVHYQDSPRPTPAAIGPRSALEGCNEFGPRSALVLH